MQLVSLLRQAVYVVLVTALFLVSSAKPVAAQLMPSADKKNFTYSGGFYSVAANNTPCVGSLSGGDNKAKIWNWLIAKGMTPYGAAGIMGNMSIESGFNPFRIQGGASLNTYEAMVGSRNGASAFGLVQWDADRRVAILRALATENPDYKQYVALKYGKGADDYKNAPADINDKFILFELEYMYKESTKGGARPLTWSKLLSAQSAAAAANTFEEVFEGSRRSSGGPHVTAANTVYSMFSGSGIAKVDPATPAAGCADSAGGLISGGMNVEQAKEFMQKYIDFAKKQRGTLGQVNQVSYDGKKFGLYFSRCSGGPLANCSTFSEFFVGAYTSGKQAYPNGRDMVRELLATKSGFTDGGHTPRVYAVFSRQSGGGGYGHTGIVLGIDKAKNQIIIGQAGCGVDLTLNNNYTVGKYLLSTFSSNDYTYAYTDKILTGLESATTDTQQSTQNTKAQ